MSDQQLINVLNKNAEEKGLEKVLEDVLRFLYSKTKKPADLRKNIDEVLEMIEQEDKDLEKSKNVNSQKLEKADVPMPSTSSFKPDLHESSEDKRKSAAFKETEDYEKLFCDSSELIRLSRRTGKSNVKNFLINKAEKLRNLAIEKEKKFDSSIPSARERIAALINEKLILKSRGLLEKEEKEKEVLDVVPKTFFSSNYSENMISIIENEILMKSPDVFFDEIANLKDAKEILIESCMLPLLMPDFFCGLREPWKGILMVGPPGTGKTMLAKAVATECSAVFFNVHSSAVTSKYVGDSEKLVRLLFEMAEFYSPSVIFIDEIDSLISKRDIASANRSLSSEFLIHMDGLSTNTEKTVIVLAATNKPWDIDTALIRRLEKRIYIPLPNRESREALLKINLQGLDLSPNLDINEVAIMLDGYSGADITSICRDVSMMAMRERIRGLTPTEIRNIQKEDLEEPLTHDDFMQAIGKINKSVSKEDLKKYDEWITEFGSK